MSIRYGESRCKRISCAMRLEFELLWMGLMLAFVFVMMMGSIEEVLPLGLEWNEEDQKIEGTVYRAEDREWLNRFLAENPQIQSAAQIDKELARELKPKSRLSSVPKSNLFFEVALLEINRNFLRQFGARFGSPLDFDLFIKQRFSSDVLNLQGMNPIAGFVDLAMDKGKAKIHFKQSVVAVPGHRAQFQVGGEFPVRVSNRHHSGIDKISYGMKIDFLPVSVNGQNIVLQLKVEVREPLGGGIDDLPQISEKVLETRLHVRMGETLSLASFCHESDRQMRKGLPFLGEIPLLGSLFSSQEFQKSKSEAYFLLTPKKLIEKGGLE